MAEGVRCVKEGDGVRVRVDLDAVESLVNKWKSQGHRVGGYLLEIPVDSVDVREYQRESGVFNAACGLAEDLVATIVRQHGGKAVLTAGGPDEAGWSLARK